MVSVVVSNIFLMLLAMAAAHASGHVPSSLALGGVMMILNTAGFLSDPSEGRKGRLFFGAQILTAVLFAFLSDRWWAFLVFAPLFFQKAWQGAVLSDLTLIVYSLISFMGRTGAGGRIERSIATLIVRVMIVTAVCLLMALFRRIEQSVKQKKEEEYQKLLAFRLGELHETQKNRELMRQSFYAEKNARLIERENLSRNIHNSVGHSITAAIMTLDAADVLFEKKPEEAHRRMNEAAERIRGSLSSIRSAVRALDEEGEDVSGKDLILYVNNILDQFLMDTDRSLERFFEFYNEEQSIPREHAEFLTGALEELLTNGVKHGNATHFLVRLSGDSAHLRLEVKDNGTSDYNPENSRERIQNGFGLKKLTSYAERCGGHTGFENEEGFHAFIELPL